MKIENLEALKFYLDAFSAHKKAGKANSAFKQKLKELFLLDQIEKEVYENMIKIVGDDEAPAIPEKAQRKAGPKGGTELPKKAQPAPKPTPEVPKNGGRKLDYDAGKAFLASGDFYVKKCIDACRGASHYSASMDDLANGEQLYTRHTIPSTDPCRGSSYGYTPVPTPLSIYANVSVWHIPESSANSSNCGGQSGRSGVSSSCSGGSSSPTGRC